MSVAQVETTLGVIAGEELEGIRVFRGIPYAQPLDGLWRVRAPRPVQAWDGVLQARDWAPAAPQEHVSMMGVGETGEACLALNIWCPAVVVSPVPVMVWIHGGGFLNGAGHQALYDATALARENGVIVVTFNYRLGILGFGEWSEWPELEAVSNAGLRDQLLALHWVQSHIAAFGGDPARVTVFGESAGGMSIACLLASPAAKGLFQRAIIQSGSPDHVVTQEEAARMTRRFAEAAGDVKACLTGSLKDLVRAQRACLSTTVNRGVHEHPVPQFGMTLLPRLGDDILPEHPLVALARGVSSDIPLMVGTTLDEWRLFYMSPQATGQKPRGEPDEERLQHEFERSLPVQGADMLERYRALLPDLSPGELFCAFETDRMFRVPTLRLAEARFGQDAPTWHYLFDWPCAWDARLGSCHVMEIPFVFGITDKPTGQFFTGGGAAAAALSVRIRAAWSRFAAGDVPAAEGWPEWAPYEATDRFTLLIAAESRLLDDPESARRQLWQGIL
ncbi:MAG: carboxylesterase family protein [Moraxellaceae bacterium]|nr:carboxylesterase family protein [Moraxellaceae bacterium]